MIKVMDTLIENTKKAYKESVLMDNTILQDLLLEILTDSKKLQEKLENISIDKGQKSERAKKKRYTYEQVKEITKIQLRLAKEEITIDVAGREILKIADHFPVHNLVQYSKRYKKALDGIGEYGFAFPSNWAKALLESTNNNPLVVKALREQQRLYREKDGRINQTLEDLLNGL